MEPGPWKRKLQALEGQVQQSLVDFGISLDRAAAANFRDLSGDPEGKLLLLNHALGKFPRNDQSEDKKAQVEAAMEDLFATANITVSEPMSSQVLS